MMINLPDYTTRLRAAAREFAAKHGYEAAYEATLGNGNGKVVVDNSAPPGLVWFQFDSVSGSGDVGQAVQHPNLPVAETFASGAPLNGMRVLVGKMPAVLGDHTLFHVIAINTTLGSLAQTGGQNPIINNNSLTVATSDGLDVETGVQQIIVPPGGFTDLGNGVAAFLFQPISGGSTTLLGIGVTSALAYKSGSSHAITATPTIYNFDTFLTAYGNANSSQVVTGSGWNFTAPVSGTYLVGVQYVNPPAPTAITVQVQTTSRLYTAIPFQTSGSSWEAILSIYMSAGETASVKIATTPNTNNNTMSLVEIGWIDATANAVVYKPPVVACSTSNIPIGNPPFTIDSHGLTFGDRILLAGQTIGSENGLWLYHGTGGPPYHPLTRPADYPSGSTTAAVLGITVDVLNGTANGHKLWQLTAPSGTITIDSTATTWSPVDVSGSVHYQTDQVDGSVLPQEPINNFISGVGVNVSGADDSGNTRSNITFAFNSDVILTDDNGDVLVDDNGNVLLSD